MRGSQKKASLTVEAALVFPVFLLLVIGFLYFFQLFLLQERIQASITEVSKYASKFGYIYERLIDGKEEEIDSTELDSIMNGLVSGAIYKQKFIEYLNEDGLNDCFIENGLDGISFLHSSFMQEEYYIDIIANYRVTIPIMFFQNIPFDVVQRVRTRAFVGMACEQEAGLDEQEDDENEEYVYITKTGTVYHKIANCTYLKFSIRPVPSQELANLRNQSGGIYYPCESCMSNQELTVGTYYITTYGDRYHRHTTCNKLKREISKVKLSEVGNRRPCSKCGK